MILETGVKRARNTREGGGRQWSDFTQELSFKPYSSSVGPY